MYVEGKCCVEALAETRKRKRACELACASSPAKSVRLETTSDPQLCSELWRRVLCFLDGAGLVDVRAVCRDFERIINGDLVLRKRLAKVQPCDLVDFWIASDGWQARLLQGDCVPWVKNVFYKHGLVSACKLGKVSAVEHFFGHTQDLVTLQEACLAAAAYGHLDCLVYTYQKTYPQDREARKTLSATAASETTDRVYVVTEKGLRWTRKAPLGKRVYDTNRVWCRTVCRVAAENGNLECLKYAHENIRPQGCSFVAGTLRSEAVPGFETNVFREDWGWDEWTTVSAAEKGHLDCLRYARENGCPWSKWTTINAAENGHLECLKYAHENGCVWGRRVCSGAAENGHLKCLVYAHENGCEWDRRTTARAAENGHLDCLKYAHESGCEWDEETCSGAAENGELRCLQYARENGCPWDAETCAKAARNGYLSCIKYAHENNAPWNERTCSGAAEGGHLDCLRYAHENGCEWDSQKTCLSALEHGSLECLVYAHENTAPENHNARKVSLGTQAPSPAERSAFPRRGNQEGGCLWSNEICKHAAKQGYLDCLRYAHENGAGWDERTCSSAARNGNLACLRYARENGCPWDKRTCNNAAKNGNLECLRYAHKNGCPWDECTCTSAAINGNLACLQYAHENGCPWNEKTCSKAADHGQLSCLKYAHQNGCPWRRKILTRPTLVNSSECLKYARESAKLFEE